MNDPLRFLSPTLIAERGIAGNGVAIWRPDRCADVESSARQCTVGEWLSMPENQSGTWLIDGGWGGPPGPIHVRWDEAQRCWENGGFCGHRFAASKGGAS